MYFLDNDTCAKGGLFILPGFSSLYDAIHGWMEKLHEKRPRPLLYVINNVQVNGNGRYNIGNGCPGGYACTRQLYTDITHNLHPASLAMKNPKPQTLIPEDGEKKEA
jgi:hypothetical protein